MRTSEWCMVSTCFHEWCINIRFTIFVFFFHCYHDAMLHLIIFFLISKRIKNYTWLYCTYASSWPLILLHYHHYHYRMSNNFLSNSISSLHIHIKCNTLEANSKNQQSCLSVCVSSTNIQGKQSTENVIEAKEH